MFTLALKSFRNRKFTTILTIVSISLSVTLLLGVERIRKETRTSFTNTISGTDLIAGARSGPVQLLLYSVDPAVLWEKKLVDISALLVNINALVGTGGELVAWSSANQDADTKALRQDYNTLVTVRNRVN